MAINISSIRQQFPGLANPQLVYLDSAASSQTAQPVLDAMQTHAVESTANVHRGMHMLSERATVAYEEARATIAGHIGANPHEIVFTKSCTESLNLVARTWAEANLEQGDTIVLTTLEHHSNIVPWQQLAERKGANIAWLSIDDTGAIAADQLQKLLEGGTVKLVSLTGLSNVLGVRTPLEEVITLAHTAGAKVCVDAAQLVAHSAIDVAQLDCDFLAFSGHKLYGPTGIGVLYGKYELLKQMPPFLGGGMMIGQVTSEGFTTADAPQKFEAGTPPIAQSIGLAAAIDWLSPYSWEDIAEHEDELIAYAHNQLEQIDGLSILGAPKVGCVSFTIDDVHPHDLTHIIGNADEKKDSDRIVCLRAGHHCCQPLHKHFGIPASTRLSVGIYNTKEEIDLAVQAIKEACSHLRS